MREYVRGNAISIMIFGDPLPQRQDSPVPRSAGLTFTYIHLKYIPLKAMHGDGKTKTSASVASQSEFHAWPPVSVSIVSFYLLKREHNVLKLSSYIT